MSKKTRKKKTATTAVLPKTKTEPPKEEVVIPESKLMMVSEKPKTPEATTKPELSKSDQMEVILKEAPRLGWNFDIAYIDNEFRKKYVALLKKLVALYDLPYLVDQTATLQETVKTA